MAIQRNLSADEDVLERTAAMVARRAVATASASATAATAPDPLNGSTSSVPQSPSSPELNSSGGGGADIPNPPRSGDGGNREPFFERKDLRVLFYMALMVFAVGLYVFAQEKFVQSITPSAREVHVAAAVVPEKQQPVQQAVVPETQNALIYVNRFECSDEVQKMTGFENATAQHLRAGQAFHIPVGCASIQNDTTVTKLNADQYQLIVPIGEKPGHSYQCGNMGGRNETLTYCADFLNIHAGKKVLVIVGNNGYVNINR